MRKQEMQKKYFDFLKEQSFYKKYIGNVDLSKYKYLKFDYRNNPQPVGFVDTLNQFKDCCRLAYLLNLKLIEPNKPLCASHNAGKKLDFIFSDYYDADSVEILGNKIDIIKNEGAINADFILTLKGLLYVKKDNMSNPKCFPNLLLLRRILRKRSMPVSFNVLDKYKNASTNFILKNDIQGCIHIRRGDRLKVGSAKDCISPEEMDYGTRSKNILNFLDSLNAPKSIYIMTDMKADDQILSELRKSNYYNFSFLYDYEELVSLKQKNNYEVFHLESCIKESNLIKFKADRFDPVFYYKNHL